MPFRDPRKYLYDIIDCSKFLLDFTESKTVEDYKNDRAFRSAVERELQIIGEAITQLDRVSPKTADKISEHRNIIGFRNVLVHGYDSLNPDTVWDVVENKLAQLLSQAENCLKQL